MQRKVHKGKAADMHLNTAYDNNQLAQHKRLESMRAKWKARSKQRSLLSTPRNCSTRMQGGLNCWFGDGHPRCRFGPFGGGIQWRVMATNRTSEWARHRSNAETIS